MNGRFIINQWSMITSLMIAALITVGYYGVVQLEEVIPPHTIEELDPEADYHTQTVAIVDKIIELRTWVLSGFWVLGTVLTFLAVRYFELDRRHFYWLIAGTFASYLLLRFLWLERLVNGTLWVLTGDELIGSIVGVGFFMLVAAATFNLSIVSLVKPETTAGHTDILDTHLD